MHFIFARGQINNFKNKKKIRQDYEEKRGVNLHAKQSFFGKPIFLGGIDVISRNQQITFLEKIETIIKIHLLNEEKIETHDERQAYLITVRFIIAAFLYVEHQIGSKGNSVLYQLMEDYLGITKENYLDVEDKETCFLTAQRLINSPGALDQANITLGKDGLPSFTELEWSQFSDYIKEKCHKKDDKQNKTNFPVIAYTKPLFGSAFSYVGASVGVVLAEGVTNSTTAVGPRVHLTALVGSTLLVFSPGAGAAGMALLAPVIATKLLTSFCTISLAQILSNTAGLLGQGVGIGVGLPFDLAYNLLWSVCSAIARYYSNSPHLAPIDGIRIGDGAIIIAGIPIQLVAENALPPGITKKMLTITEKGEMHIEGEEITDQTPMQIPTEVLEELKKCQENKMNADKSDSDDKKDQITVDTENTNSSEAATSPKVEEKDEEEVFSLI